MKKIISFSVVALLALCFASCKQDKATPKPTVVDCASITYSHDIAPIINSNCISCFGDIAAILIFNSSLAGN